MLDYNSSENDFGERSFLGRNALQYLRNYLQSYITSSWSHDTISKKELNPSSNNNNENNNKP